jgi:hypothetical protein
MKSEFERAGNRHLMIMVAFVLGLGVLILLFLMLVAPARAHHRNIVRDCDPGRISALEFFCVRNPNSCDPEGYWYCLSIRCAEYLRQLRRRVQRCDDGDKGVVPQCPL